MKGIKGVIALMLLLFWGPASIASTYAGTLAPAKSCISCSQKEKRENKNAGKADGDFKLSSASQPAPNHFQLQHDDQASQPFLPTEFVFACPTLLGNSISANTRGQYSRLQKAFFSRLLKGSISAQAP